MRRIILQANGGYNTLFDGSAYLCFEDNFFESEERSGFVIESKMKRAWASSMEVLARLDRICREYGLRYYVTLGTLLGAVRHSGFVPWDDDIDIMMPRADFNSFRRVLEDDMSGELILNTDTQIYGLLSTENVRTESKEDLPDRFHGCRFITGLDIFILDYLPSDETLRNQFLGIYASVYDIYANYEEYETSGILAEKFAFASQMLGQSIPSTMSKLNVWRLCESLAATFKADESDYLMWLPGAFLERPFYNKKEWWSDTIDMQFENMTVYAPSGYDEFLTEFYGDWRTPINTGSSHNYPFYREMDEYLQSIGIVD